jgi:hypothetical protein
MTRQEREERQREREECLALLNRDKSDNPPKGKGKTLKAIYNETVEQALGHILKSLGNDSGGSPNHFRTLAKAVRDARSVEEAAQLLYKKADSRMRNLRMVLLKRLVLIEAKTSVMPWSYYNYQEAVVTRCLKTLKGEQKKPERQQLVKA